MLIRLNFDYSQGFVEERILFGFRLVAIPSFFLLLTFYVSCHIHVTYSCKVMLYIHNPLILYLFVHIMISGVLVP